MGVEKSCGAITGGVMAISTIFVKGRAKVDERFKEINRKLFSRVQDELGSTDCDRLKAMYRDEVIGCQQCNRADRRHPRKANRRRAQSPLKYGYTLSFSSSMLSTVFRYFSWIICMSKS